MEELRIQGQEELRSRLIRLIHESDAYIERPVRLSSGKTSKYYFDVKKITMNPEGTNVVSDMVVNILSASKARVRSVGGLETGSIPVVANVVLKSFLLGHPVEGFYIRKHKKRYGLKNDFEGHPVSPVAVVDDVATSGTTILKTIRKIERAGHRVARVIAVVDREEGAERLLRANGYRFDSLIKRGEFVASGA